FNSKIVKRRSVKFAGKKLSTNKPIANVVKIVETLGRLKRKNTKTVNTKFKKPPRESVNINARAVNPAQAIAINRHALFSSFNARSNAKIKITAKTCAYGFGVSYGPVMRGLPT